MVFYCYILTLCGFFFQSRQGAPLFTWTDAQGIQHTLPGSNCNQNDPIWKKDSIEITDLASLPVKKINYGPLVYEAEEAKVVVSAITCKPPALAKWSEHTTTGKFTTLKTEFTQKLTETKDSHDENYQLLNTALENLKGKVDQKERTIDSKITSLKNEFTQKLKEAKEGNDEKYQLLNTALDTFNQEVEFPNQCSNYKKLTRSERRFDHTSTSSNRKCDITVSSNKASDWKGEGWYRVEGAAGSQLSEAYSRWKYYGCWTHHGGHLIGGHPEINEQTVTRTVCSHTSCTGNDKKTIKVTKCNGYYVYFLPEMFGCSRGYCTQ